MGVSRTRQPAHSMAEERGGGRGEGGGGGAPAQRAEGREAERQRSMSTHELGACVLETRRDHKVLAELGRPTGREDVGDASHRDATAESDDGEIGVMRRRTCAELTCR